MKKIMPLISVLCILICLFTACSDEKYTRIDEFPQFAEMTQTGTDSITVRFDNDDGGYFEFTVENETDIDAVMSIVFSLEFSDGSKEHAAPGNNSYITINQGANRFDMSVRYIAADDRYYYFGTDLQTKIYDLAAKAGAFG